MAIFTKSRRGERSSFNEAATCGLPVVTSQVNIEIRRVLRFLVAFSLPNPPAYKPSPRRLPNPPGNREGTHMFTRSRLCSKALPHFLSSLSAREIYRIKGRLDFSRECTVRTRRTRPALACVPCEARRIAALHLRNRRFVVVVEPRARQTDDSFCLITACPITPSWTQLAESPPPPPAPRRGFSAG